MPPTGRPPKPTEQKRKLGFPGHHPRPANPIVALEPVEKPPMPSVPTEADKVIEEIWGLAGAWIGRTDLLLVGLLRDALNRRSLLLADLDENGWSYESTGPLGNRFFSRPQAIELRNLEKQITSWMSLLALTPVDRARLGVAEVKQRTKLEELADRRAARAAGRRPS